MTHELNPTHQEVADSATAKIVALIAHSEIEVELTSLPDPAVS